MATDSPLDTPHFQDLCRLCANKTTLVVGVNIFGVQDLNISHKIQTCLPVVIRENDHLPKIICNECLYRLNMLSDFRERSLRTEHLLLELYRACHKIISTHPDSSLDHHTHDNHLMMVHMVGSDDNIDLAREDMIMSHQMQLDLTSINSSHDDHGGDGIILNDSTTETSHGTLYHNNQHVGFRQLVDNISSTVLDDDSNCTNYQLIQSHDNSKIDGGSDGNFQHDGNKVLIKNNEEILIMDNSSSSHSLMIDEKSLSNGINVGSFHGGDRDDSIDSSVGSNHIFLANCDVDGFNNNQIFSPAVEGHDGGRHYQGDVLEEYKQTVNIKEEDPSSNDSVPRNDPKFNPDPLIAPTVADITSDSPCRKTSNSVENSPTKKFTPKICKDCGKIYQTNYKLNEHRRKHTGEKPYKCGSCDKEFRSKIGLAQHAAKHTGQYDFSCHICGKGFQCKSYLMVHQRVHSNVKPYPCTTCGQSFKTKQSLLDHTNRHLGVKPYMCEICGRGFITKGLCKAHEKIHTGQDNRKYSCKVCHKMFVSKSYLRTHLRIHTGEKPFVCEVCNKGFLTKVDLRIHMTLHTGEKSYVCEICGKAFARRDALRCHRRSHTGERPYRCELCGQTFTQFTPMAIHKRLHTGERPYICETCGKSFVSKSTMVAHAKKHSKVESVCEKSEK